MRIKEPKKMGIRISTASAKHGACLGIYGGLRLHLELMQAFCARFVVGENPTAPLKDICAIYSGLSPIAPLKDMHLIAVLCQAYH